MPTIPDLLAPAAQDVPATISQPNGLADAIQQTKDRGRSEFVSTLETVAKVNPDQFARATEVQRLSGVPAETLYKHTEKVEQLLQGNKYAALYDNYGKTAAALRDGKLATLAQDDLDNLARVEQAGQVTRFNEQSLGEKLVNTFKQSLLTTSQGAGVSYTDKLQRLAGNFDRIDQEIARAAAAGEQPYPGGDNPIGFGFEYLQGTPEDRQAMRERLLGKQSEAITGLAADQAELDQIPPEPGALRAQELGGDLAGTAAAIAENPGYAARASLGAAASSVEMLLAGAIGGPLAAGAVGFAAESNVKLLDVLREAGVDMRDAGAVMTALQDDTLMTDARERAARKAAGTTAVDMLSMGLAGKLLAPTRLGGRELSRVQRELANLAVQFPVQGVGEGLGEAAGQLAADGEIDAGEVLLETIAGAGMSSLDVAAFGGERVWTSISEGLAKSRQARQAKAALGEMVDSSINSKLKGRDLGAYQALTEQQLKGSAVENIWIPAADLAQLNQSGTDLAAILERIPGLTEQFAEAEARGGSISLKTADYLTYFAEQHEQLAGSVRLQVEGMSTEDAVVWQQEQEAEIAMIAQQMSQAPDARDDAYVGLIGELKQAGYRQADAEQYAATHLSAMTTLAERTGKPLAELLARFPLDVRATAPETLQRVPVDDVRLAVQRLRAGDVPQAADMFGKSLGEYLRDAGGVNDTGGELAALDVNVGKVGRNRVVREGGNSMDDMAMQAWERGYFPGVAREDVGPQLIVDAMREELAGSPVYSAEQENATLRDQAETLRQLDEYLQKLDVDLSALSDDEVLAILRDPGALDGKQLNQGADEYAADLAALADFYGQPDDFQFDNFEQREAVIDRLVARAEADQGFGGLQLPTSYGSVMVTPSAKEPGKWQVTQFAQDGTPNSDNGIQEKTKALRDFFEEARPPADTRLSQDAAMPRLSAVHNMTEDNLRFAADMGGIAVPSIGVVTEQAGEVEGFGDITMIASKDMVDPKKTPVFSSDAYTVRFPRAEYPKVKDRAATKLTNEIEAVAAEFDEPGIASRTFDSMVNRPDPQEIIFNWENSPAIQALYLRESGEDVGPVMTEAVPSTTLGYTDAVQAIGKQEWIYDTLLQEPPAEAMAQAEQVVQAAIEQHVQTRATALGISLDDQRAEAIRGRLQRIYLPDGKVSMREWAQLINAALGADTKPVAVDRIKTREAMREQITGQEVQFKEWIEGKVLPMFGEPFLLVGKSKKPYTMENILKVMTAKAGRGKEETMTYGPGQVKAATSEQFRDLERMRERAASSISDVAEYNQAKEQTERQLSDWRQVAVQFFTFLDYRGKVDTFEAMDASMRALAKFSTSKKQDAAALERELKAEGFDVDRMKAGAAGPVDVDAIARMQADVDKWAGRIMKLDADDSRVPDVLARLAQAEADLAAEQAKAGEQLGDVIGQGMTAAKALMAAPVPYFEAKPQRAVSLGEFAGAVIPSTANTKTREILKANGIPFVEYDKTSEGGRSKALREFREQLASEGKSVLFQSGNPQTETEAFKNWFGDSKVVDANGEPLVVYHGTASDISEFDISRSGESTNNTGFYGEGAYFTEDIEDAAGYAGWAERGDGGRNLIPVYLSISRPVYVHINPKTEVDKSKSRHSLQILLDQLEKGGAFGTYPDPNEAGSLFGKLTKYLANAEFEKFMGALYNSQGGGRGTSELAKRAGFDGVTVYSFKRGKNMLLEAVAFKPEQIKSAIGNNGDFSPASPNILNQGEDGKGPRGSITFTSGKKRSFQISLSAKRDLSTLLHELGHYYLEVMADLATDADASQQIRDDVSAIRAWTGAKDSGAFEVEQHEAFARGFERYLAEGKAPNPELQGAFARFKRWMLAIYKDLARLNVELNDEIRGVFDRLVATDQQIADAERVTSAMPLFESAAKAGMSDVEFAAYRKQVEASADDARTSIEQQIIREEERRQGKWWREESAKVRREVEEEIDTLPEYAAIRALRKGVMPDGSTAEIKLQSGELRERYGLPATRKLAFMHAKKGGLPMDVAASMLGYQSGDEMIKAILGAVPRAQLVQQETEQRMLERHGPRSTGEAAERAMHAVHNEKRAAVLIKELAALGKQGNRNNITSQQILKQAAERIMQERKVRDVQPFEYQRAEGKAGRLAFEAAAKGDLAAAYEHKQQQLLNFYLWREARKARDAIDSIVGRLGEYNKTSKREKLGKAGHDYLDQVDAVMEQYEFRNVSLRQLDKRVSFQKWYADQLALGNEPMVPEFILNTQGRINYKDLSLAQLTELDEFVANIAHLAKLKNKLLGNQRIKDFDDAKNLLIKAAYDNLDKQKAAPIDKATLTLLENADDWLTDMGSALLKMEQIVEWLDGGDVGGPWSTIFWQPFVEAQVQKDDLNREFTQKLMAMVDTYTAKRGAVAMREQIHIPEIGQALTRNAIISAALNTGNASNRSKLLKGYGWDENQLQAVLQHMSGEDWTFAQSLWDLVESLWPSIEQLEKDLHGLAPAKVEPVAVTTRFGEFKGGYWPLVYDTSSAAYAGVASNLTDSTGLFEQGYAKATTPKGHTKARVDAFAAPILLDTGIVASHLAQVIHDLTHRRAIRDAAKIIGNREIKQALNDTLGVRVADQFNPWLQGVANDMVLDGQKGIDAWTRLSGQLRANLSVAWMGFSATTGLQQILGLSGAYEYMAQQGGRRYLLQGVQEFITHPIDVVRFVRGLSGEMRNREGNLDNNMREVLKRIGGKTSGLAMLQRLAFKHIGLIQSMVDYPTWLAGYHQAMANGDGADIAIAAGDRAVRLSQMAAGPKDLAAVQRKDGLMKALTIVYSYFNLLYNRTVDVKRSLQTAKGMADYLTAFERTMFLIAIPAVLGPLMTGQGPDDDESFGKWVALKALTYPLMGIPLLRDLASALESGWGYRGATPLGSVGETLTRLAGSVTADEPDAERISLLLIDSAGYSLGVPAAQPKRTVKYLFDFVDGDARDDDMAAFMRGVLFGPPKKTD